MSLGFFIGLRCARFFLVKHINEVSDKDGIPIRIYQGRSSFVGAE